ncbi:MAG: GNAT family N-acetyltransferase [Gemmatimonadota bacterium]
MTTAQAARSLAAVSGPHPVRPGDIAALNRVFSEAFTERYRRDGLTGVRVPNLNPAIWRFAIEGAGEGAMMWRDESEEIIAFNVAHLSGVEGWMGPIAVHPQWQGSGLGKLAVRAGVELLRSRGASVIGLETMPRTMDNIGFYSRLGFVPGHLTITLSVESAPTTRQSLTLSSLSSSARDDVLAECSALSRGLLDGFDYSREIELTLALALGDAVLLREGGVLQGFALFHTTPLVDGRSREETRILKLVLRDESLTAAMATAVADAAWRCGTLRTAIRVQAAYPGMYRPLLDLGARVRWTDLRMALHGYTERRPEVGVVLSNWEI